MIVGCSRELHRLVWTLSQCTSSIVGHRTRRHVQWTCCIRTQTASVRARTRQVAALA